MESPLHTKILFPSGDIYITPLAQSFVNERNINIHWLILRHITGDWGELCPEDMSANNLALEYGERIFSSYPMYNDKLWIITESDRSATTILMPEEY